MHKVWAKEAYIVGEINGCSCKYKVLWIKKWIKIKYRSFRSAVRFTILKLKEANNRTRIKKIRYAEILRTRILPDNPKHFGKEREF